MSLSLRTKLLLSLLASSIIPIVLICVVLGIKVKNSSMDTFFNNAGIELSHIEKAISIFIDETKANTAMMAKHPAVLAADDSLNSFIDKTEPSSSAQLTAGPVERAILDLANDLADTHQSYVAVYLGTKFGGFAMSGTDTLPPGYDPRKRPWYKEALDHQGIPLISKAYPSTTGSVVITATESVQDNNGVLGVVGVDVTLDGLTQFINTIKVGKTGYVLLVQDDGVILADPRVSDNNFKNLGELPGDYKELAGLKEGNKIVEINDQSYAARVLTSSSLGWKLIGLEEKKTIMADVYSMLFIIAGIGGLIAAAFMVFGIFLAGSLAKPIVTTTRMIKDIAEGEGDLTKRLDVTSKDELGQLAQWFNQFLDSLQKIIGDIASHAAVVDGSSGKLLNIASKLAVNAGQTSEKAQSVVKSTAEMNDNMSTIASTMEETTNNTTMVAAAVEEMAATINEIAQNSEKARSVSEGAVTQATSASVKVNELGEAANAISAVTETITEISEQTNLLALNATIEAARAGEAGKGFAVVANEIKELAKQTAEATAEIKAKIEGVQDNTNTTVKEIESIGSVIHDINDIISTIATAIEEQSAATNEISTNVTQASHGIEEVNQKISEGTVVIDEISTEVSTVNNSATEISENSTSIEQNSNELKQLANELNTIIKRFKF